MKKYILIGIGFLLFSCEKIEIISNPPTNIDVQLLTNFNLALKGQIPDLQSATIQNVSKDKSWQANVSSPNFKSLASINRLGETLQNDFYYENAPILPQALNSYFSQHYAQDGAPVLIERLVTDKNAEPNQYRVWVFDDKISDLKYLYFDAVGNLQKEESYDQYQPAPVWVYSWISEWNVDFKNALNQIQLLDEKGMRYSYFVEYYQNMITKKHYYLVKIAQSSPSNEIYYVRIDENFKVLSIAKTYAFDKGFINVPKGEIPQKMISFIDGAFPNGWNIDFSILKYGTTQSITQMPIEYYTEVGVINMGSITKAKLTFSNTGKIKYFTIVSPILKQTDILPEIVSDLNLRFGTSWKFLNGESRFTNSILLPNSEIRYVEIQNNADTYEFFYALTGANTQQLYYFYKKQSQ